MENRAGAIEIIHGVKIEDPFRWLEAESSPEVTSWVEAQNQYTSERLASTGIREQVLERVQLLARFDTVSAPARWGGRYFFSKRLADQDRAAICMRRTLGGPDEILIDPSVPPWSATTSVSILHVSSDGQRLVYGSRDGGEDEVSVGFLDVDTGFHWPDLLPRGRYYGTSLTPDKRYLIYSRWDQDGPRVLRHTIGEAADRDQIIFGDGRPGTQTIYSFLSRNGRYLVMWVRHQSSGKGSEIYVQDMQTECPPAIVIDDAEHMFEPWLAGDTLYLRTNWKAPKGRILATDLPPPLAPMLREVVPESESVITGLSLVGKRICVQFLCKDGQTVFRMFDAFGCRERELVFTEPGTADGMWGDWDSPEAFYTFSSFVRRPTVYRYDVGTGEQRIWSRHSSAIDSTDIQITHVNAVSKDGVLIPIFLAHKRNLRRDGELPTLLTAYGGFGVSMTPEFSPRTVLWLERGGVFALACVRGGGELGEAWHVAGQLGDRKNSFDDLISAAEWLIHQGYTNASKLGVIGNSNGGLLVAGAMSERPDLFGAVVCQYPLLDMLRYHKYGPSQLWLSEYGTADDPDQFEYLYRYSPYHRIANGVAYPAVLFVTGNSDTRVPPFHAFKATAALQKATSSEKPILLRCRRGGGHSGEGSLNLTIEEMADELTLFLWQLGAAPSVKAGTRTDTSMLGLSSE